MPLENEYVGRTEVGADSYLGPTKYRVTCRCLRCGKTYSRVVSRLSDKNPPCPRKACKEAVAAEERTAMERNIRAMIESERAPGQVGANVQVRAIDETAKIVMEDHGLTNLKDNIREGDQVAPRLPPKLQDAADNFFNWKQAGRGKQSRQLEVMGRKAIAGAYRNMAVNPQQVIGRKKGEPALVKVGEGKLS